MTIHNGVLLLSDVMSEHPLRATHVTNIGAVGGGRGYGARKELYWTLLSISFGFDSLHHLEFNP
jgi:hypothetical protein